MSDFKWNDQQLEAIESSGKTILVSAAAGSGKTAVLVERIIRKITGKNNPANIEDFLIVTFTKAAASQMKEKISSALSAVIAESPENIHLRENKFKLPFANIGTIDSFAISLARDNFDALEISPDFTILESGRKAIIEKNAISQVIEEFHRDYGERFENLNNILNDNKSDKVTEDTIKILYDKSMAQIFPEDWLDSLVKNYEKTKLTDDETVKYLLKDILKNIDDFRSRIEYAYKLLNASEENLDKAFAKIEECDLIINKLVAVIEKDDWEEIRNELESFSYSNIRATIKDPEIKDIVDGIRTDIKKYLNSLNEKFFCYTQDEVDSYKDKILPSVEILIKAVKRYREILDEIKRKENAYCFDDILHFAIRLLVDKEDGKPVKSNLAKELSANFNEIFVDEYQDVNAAQDIIFESLSRDDKNRFLVGDIKQSIYSFRNAMPEVFLSLRDNEIIHPDINRIYLNNNYRSRSEVTGTVNYIFSRLMSKETGDVDYNDSERLNPSAPFDSTPDIKIEFNLVNCAENSADNLRYQAIYTANKISEAIKNKLQIVRGKDEDENDITSDAEYSDFAILYRNKKCGKVFAEVFEEKGIPFVSDNDDTFIESPEINFIKCLLRVIDNPTDDIALATAMLSPVYGFTPDDLALMRAELPYDNNGFYKCVLKASSDGNKKAGEFIAVIEKLRRSASVMPAGEFTADIIDITGLRAIVSRMHNSKARLANINSFINLANSYENSGIKGLSAFVRYVMKLEDRDVTVSSKSSSDNANCVKMMTIHKSKGLEFPVVILANTEKEFNYMDSYSNVIISPKAGLGLKYIENSIRYNNLNRELSSKEVKESANSEELRILYVALTRAKERLIILASETKKFSVNNVRGILPNKGQIDILKVRNMNSYAKMIASALMSHPDAHTLRSRTEGAYTFSDYCKTRIDFNIITELEEKEIESETETEYKSNPVLMEEIKKRLEYSYPYESLNRIRAKAIASNLGEKSFNRKYFASSTPSFSEGNKLTGAQKGTATHLFMQYCDFTKAKVSVQDEAKRLLSSGRLSPTQANSLDYEAIAGFFTSDTAKRIMNSDKVYREYKFTSLLPVSDLYPETITEETQDEVIVIEGVVDCAFEENGKLIIVDFKTDYAEKETDLIEEYTPQLDTYRKCLGKVLDIEVAQTLIYSFRLNKEILIG